MRGFGGRRPRKPDEFNIGVFWGFVSALALGGVLRVLDYVAQWESVGEAAEAVSAALTTPVLSVSDLMLIVGVLFLIACVVVANAYMGGFRA